jgi:hypothetical protein
MFDNELNFLASEVPCYIAPITFHNVPHPGRCIIECFIIVTKWCFFGVPFIQMHMVITISLDLLIGTWKIWISRLIRPSQDGKICIDSYSKFYYWDLIYDAI